MMLRDAKRKQTALSFLNAVATSGCNTRKEIECNAALDFTPCVNELLGLYGRVFRHDYSALKGRFRRQLFTRP